MAKILVKMMEKGTTLNDLTVHGVFAPADRDLALSVLFAGLGIGGAHQSV